MGQERKSIVVFTDWREKFARLSDEQFGHLMRMCLDYAIDDTVEESPDPMVQLSFEVLKSALDANFSKWDESKRRRQEAGRKGGLAKSSNAKQSQAMLSNAKQDVAMPSVTVTGTVTGTVTDTVTVTDNVTVIKESKHAFGEYAHVRLKESEFEKLKADYGEELTEQAIKYLDEYIEMKGAKYKSHYLAIRKWVIDAVKEHQPKKSKAAAELDDFYQMAADWAKEG